MTREIHYYIRYQGQRCAAVRTGLANEPILFRAREKEEVFTAKALYPNSVEDQDGPKEARKIFIKLCRAANLECARLIKRTKAVRRKLCDQQFEDMRLIDSAQRLALIGSSRSRGGRQWKICRRSIVTTLVPTSP